MFIEVRNNDQLKKIELSSQVTANLLYHALISAIKNEELEGVTTHWLLTISTDKKSTLTDIFSPTIHEEIKRTPQLIGANEKLEKITLTDTEILNWFYLKFADKPEAQKSLIKQLGAKDNSLHLLAKTAQIIPSPTSSVHHPSNSNSVHSISADGSNQEDNFSNSAATTSMAVTSYLPPTADAISALNQANDKTIHQPLDVLEKDEKQKSRCCTIS